MIQLKREPELWAIEVFFCLAFTPTFCFMLQSLSAKALALTEFGGFSSNAIYEAFQRAGSICTDTETQGFPTAFV